MLRFVKFLKTDRKTAGRKKYRKNSMKKRGSVPKKLLWMGTVACKHHKCKNKISIDSERVGV